LARRFLGETAVTLGGPGTILIVLLFTGMGLAIARAEGVVALVAPSLLGSLGLMLLVRFLTADDDPDVARRIIRWTAAAFVIHLVLSLVINNTLFLLRYLGPDARTYDRLAQEIVQHWTRGFPMPYVPSGKEGFYYLLAGLYRVFGPYSVAGLAINATMAAALIPLTSDTTRRLFGARAARYAAPLTLLVPGVLIWTSQLLKEAPIIFLLAVAANCAARVSERLSLAPGAILALTMALLFTFRGWVGVMAAGGFIIGVAFGRRELLSGLGTGVTALALISVLVVVTGLGYTGYKTAANSDLEQANVLRRDLAVSASSGFHADVDISTPARALSYLPRALLSFLLGPFPWELRGGRQLVALPDVLVWWALQPSLFRGIRAAAKRRGRQILVLLLPAATMSVLLALAIGNFGTLVRERTQVFILLIPFICLGLALRNPDGELDEAEVSLTEIQPAGTMGRWR
jgi:hypothetical protein